MLPLKQASLQIPNMFL